MKLWTLVWPDPPAEADLQASPGHVVQDRKVFSKPYRMPPRSYVRHLSDANPGRPCREVCPEQNRVRKIAHSIRPKVVFSEPHGLEAELLGQNCLLSEVVDEFFGRGGLSAGPRHGRERCELHDLNLPFVRLFSTIPVMVIYRDTADAMTHILGRWQALLCAPERSCYA